MFNLSETQPLARPERGEEGIKKGRGEEERGKKRDKEGRKGGQKRGRRARKIALKGLIPKEQVSFRGKRG